MFGRNAGDLKKQEGAKITAEELLEKIIDDYTSVKQPVLIQMRRDNLSKEDFLADVKNQMVTYYHPSEDVLSAALTLFEQYVFGYAVLTPLIEDPDVSDIRCISFSDIRVKRKGVREAAGVQFRTENAFNHFIEFIATKNQVNISNLNAIQCFTDNKSNPDYILRFTVIMPLLNTYGQPYLHIRKVPKNFPEIQDLIKAGMLTQQLADELIIRFRSGSTLICGGNSSGKTTLLNALKETLPQNMSVIVTQQADELTTKSHPDMMFTHSLPGTGESVVTYDLKDISIAGLTMDVDFFIVGEIKGDEAAYLLNAAYSGQICAGTLHAPAADKAIDKIIDYALYTGHYTKEELQKMLACFKTLVYMEGYKVSQIYEMVGWNSETKELEYRPIYDRKIYFDMSGFDELTGNLEEYVNKQGCTLGKDAERLQQLLHSITCCYINGVVTDKQAKQMREKLKKIFIKTLRELNEEESHKESKTDMN